MGMTVWWKNADKHPNIRVKTCRQFSFVHHIPAWIILGSNPSLLDERQFSMWTLSKSRLSFISCQPKSFNFLEWQLWEGVHLVSSVPSYPCPAVWERITYRRVQLVESSWTVAREHTILDSCLTFIRNLVRQFALSLATARIKQPDKLFVQKTLYMKGQSNLGPFFLNRPVYSSEILFTFPVCTNKF